MNSTATLMPLLSRRHLLKGSLGGLAAAMLVGQPMKVTIAQDATPIATPVATDVDWPRLTDRLAYGDADPRKQALYAWEPEPREKPRAALVYIHGGALTSGDAVDATPMLKHYAHMGFVTFSIGYRLWTRGDPPGNPWPTQLEDVQQALRWIRENADRFRIDPGRIGVMGHSSGGHLAGLLGTVAMSDQADTSDPGIASRPTCIVSVSGDLDITVPYEVEYYNELNAQIFGGTSEALESASAAYQVNDSTVPFFVAHSHADGDVPIQQARNMAAALQKQGTEFVYVELPDQSHIGTMLYKPVMLLVEAFVIGQLQPDA